mgnify:CR=1 FL=1
MIARYVAVDQNKAVVKLDRGDDVSTLEIESELPMPTAGQGRATRVAL